MELGAQEVSLGETHPTELSRCAPSSSVGIPGTRLFVVPNPSPANAHFTPADQAAWYDRLADFLASV